MKEASISRRSYLSAVGGVLFSGMVAGGSKAYEEYVSRGLGEDLSHDITIIGHRGAAGLAPENTEKAIQTAIKYDVDGVELDVQETSDGKLILFHDPIYNVKTDEGTGFVEQTPLEEAKQYEINGEPLITLEEALEIVTEHDLKLYLDVKSPNIILKIQKLLEKYEWTEHTTLISLQPSYIFESHWQYLEQINTALINKTPEIDIIPQAIEMGFEGVATHYSPINQQEFIQQANNAGLRSIIWNLFDTELSIRNSLTSNADVLIANRPDLIQQIYRRNGIEQ